MATEKQTGNYRSRSKQRFISRQYMDIRIHFDLFIFSQLENASISIFRISDNGRKKGVPKEGRKRGVLREGRKKGGSERKTQKMRGSKRTTQKMRGS